MAFLSCFNQSANFLVPFEPGIPNKSFFFLELYCGVMAKGVKARQPPSGFFFLSLARGNPAGFPYVKACPSKRQWLRGGACWVAREQRVAHPEGTGGLGVPGWAQGMSCKAPFGGEGGVSLLCNGKSTSLGKVGGC